MAIKDIKHLVNKNTKELWSIFATCFALGFVSLDLAIKGLEFEYGIIAFAIMLIASIGCFFHSLLVLMFLRKRFANNPA